MTRSPFRRLVFGTLRRLLYLWVRSETINQSSFTLNLDRSRPVFYVLQNPSLTDLAVVDTECTKAGLPRPVLPVSVGNLLEPAAFFYLTPDPDWLGRQDKRGAPPTLTRLVSALSQNAAEDAQIIPVSVFWGQSPDSENSPWKLLFADSWAVTGRLRRLLSIIVLGRKTRVQFSAPIHLRELIEHNKGHERTVRMAQRICGCTFATSKPPSSDRIFPTGAIWSRAWSTSRWSSKRSSTKPSVKTSLRKKPRPKPCATATRSPRTTPTLRSASWKWC